MTTVADIVIANPAAARVFERYDIDYCCHGQRPLDEACADAGADLAAVERELAAAVTVEADRRRATTAGTDELPDDVGALIGRIVATHHTFLRRELPRLDDLMGTVVAAHGTRHPEVHEVARLLVELTDDLLPHLMKEEKVLFPLAIELLGAVEPPSFPCGSVTNPIRVMHLEHDRVGELLAELRRRTGAYSTPADACPTWRALYAGLAALELDIHTHVHLENNVLFPRVVALEAALTA
jgi:regulator of cell morphogenesis and NO signaling